jgi:hypothetical protein
MRLRFCALRAAVLTSSSPGIRNAFSYFIDLRAAAPGRRLRPVVELGEALEYLDRSYTNLLVYRA